jgi:HEAT repeat protein
MRIRLQQDKEAILKILQSEDIERKLRIIDKLNGVNEKESIRILMKTLEDRSWCMRERAAYKLAAYGKRVSARLSRLLKKGYWYTRASACLALGEIADMRTLDSIITLLLSDENPSVQKEASNALTKLARKKPTKFSARLKTLTLTSDEVHTVLTILERADAELYHDIEDILNDTVDV